MACLFALLSILSYYKIKSKAFKFWWVSFFYFISMLAFESTVFFPAIMILLLIFEKESTSSVRKWSAILLLTLVFHLLIRYWIAGSILGSYGEDFFQSGTRTYILNIAKVCGRLILPPSKNEILLTTIFTLLTALTVFYVIINYRKLKQTRFTKSIQLFLGMLFISCVIPVITGISTQTSESDRLLYFPSVFLCIVVGMIVGCGIHNLWSKRVIVLVIMSYNLFFLEQNNRNWRKASSITKIVLEKSTVLFRNHTRGMKVYFINLPDEINGAFVFRHGFPEAVRLYGMDSSCFIPVNYLLRADMEKISEKKILDTTDPEINFPPNIKLKYASTGCEQIFDKGKLKFITSPGDLIYFWNYNDIDSLRACISPAAIIAINPVMR
jgi:MFS family permease